MNRTRLTLIRSGHIVPGPVTIGVTPTVQADSRAVQARQRDAGRVCKAMKVLQQAAQRPTTDNRGRRVVDARTVRVNAFVGA